MKAIKIPLGLHICKDFIPLAIVETGDQAEIRRFGSITNDLHLLEKALACIRSD